MFYRFPFSSGENDDDDDDDDDDEDCCDDELPLNIPPYAPWMEYIHLDNHRFKPNGGTYFFTCYAAYGSRFCLVGDLFPDFIRTKIWGMRHAIKMG